MSEDYSEQALKQDCPHCERNGWAFEFLLEETQHFCVLCDAHPLIEGHILIIPKRHVSCVGEYTALEFAEFLQIYHSITDWVRK